MVENAIETGEIKSFGMISDEALIALKQAKDKLDLDLKTPEEYDAIKPELVKYLKSRLALKKTKLKIHKCKNQSNSQPNSSAI